MLLASIPKHDPSLAHTQTQFTKHPQHHTPTPSHPPPRTSPRALTYSKTTAHIHLGLSSMRSLFRRMSSGIAFRVSSSKDCMRGEEGGRLARCAMPKGNQTTHAQSQANRCQPSLPAGQGPGASLQCPWTEDQCDETRTCLWEGGPSRSSSAAPVPTTPSASPLPPSSSSSRPW